MTSKGPPQAKRRPHDHGREHMEVNTDEDIVPACIDGSQIMLSPISTQTERNIAATGQVPVRNKPSHQIIVASSILYFQKQNIDDGVIEKLLLVDFMCHRKLEVHFNANVNFVLGQNGSE